MNRNLPSFGIGSFGSEHTNGSLSSASFNSQPWTFSQQESQMSTSSSGSSTSRQTIAERRGLPTPAPIAVRSFEFAGMSGAIPAFPSLGLMSPPNSFPFTPSPPSTAFSPPSSVPPPGFGWIQTVPSTRQLPSFVQAAATPILGHAPGSVILPSRLDRREGSPRCKRLHVSNIPFTMTDDDLRFMFSTVGEVEDVQVISNDRGSKGFGFVTFRREEDAEKAKTFFNNSIINNRVIEVNDALPRNRYRIIPNAMANQIPDASRVLETLNARHSILPAPPNPSYGIRQNDRRNRTIVDIGKTIFASASTSTRSHPLALRLSSLESELPSIPASPYEENQAIGGCPEDLLFMTPKSSDLFSFFGKN